MRPELARRGVPARLGHGDRAEGVDVHEARHVLEGAGAETGVVRDPGVVHQHVDSAEGVERAGDRPAGVGDDVTGRCDGRTALVGDGRHGRRRAFLTDVVDDDVGAASGEGPGVLPSEASSCAGHQHDLSVEADRTVGCHHVFFL